MAEKRERRERVSRSSKYQYLLLESAFSHEMMQNFCTDDSISHRLDPFKYDERILDLEDELKKEFWRIVDTQLTSRQREVLVLTCQGLTQCAIAKELDINQSSITKSIHGNVDYKKKNKRGKKGTTYGGSIKRIRKLVMMDSKIKDILDRINEIREEKW